ncbi:MAG: M23 family metallopeptidase [Sulfurovaceae bacterium]|nr:M23 family metallopeptidase [Sulfurovaceae bacterium]
MSYKLIKETNFKFYRSYGYTLRRGLIHNGVDIKAMEGQLVTAPYDAVVLFASNSVSGYGTSHPDNRGGCIWLQSLESGMIFQLGHVISYLVKDQIIREGGEIGYVNDYWSMGSHCPHIHFAATILTTIPQGNWGYVHNLDDYQDPMPLVQSIIRYNAENINRK